MSYSGNMGNNDGNYGGNNTGSAFALIVVLFILLIIVGATFMGSNYQCLQFLCGKNWFLTLFRVSING